MMVCPLIEVHTRPLEVTSHSPRQSVPHIANELDCGCCMAASRLPSAQTGASFGIALCSQYTDSMLLYGGEAVVVW